MMTIKSGECNDLLYVVIEVIPDNIPKIDLNAVLQMGEYLMQGHWNKTEQCIWREFKFASFREAMSFMFLVAFEAEQMDHHPDWKNVYNRVMIELTTHDSGGVTEKDYALAAKIDAIYSRY